MIELTIKKKYNILERLKIEIYTWHVFRILLSFPNVWPFEQHIDRFVHRSMPQQIDSSNRSIINTLSRKKNLTQVFEHKYFPRSNRPINIAQRNNSRRAFFPKGLSVFSDILLI
jgi:hypothetical protein